MQNNPYMLAYMGFFLYLCRRFGFFNKNMMN